MHQSGGPHDDELQRLRAALAAEYALERVVGQGGMATVFLARERRHDRPLALKVLRPAVRDRESIARFVREVRLTARLVHPHILPLVGSGEAIGLPYYTMPYVDGESLSQRLRRDGRLSLEATVAVACDLADALAHAHASGVLHRDVKPGNVMLAGRHALLGDFGIAKAMHAATVDDDATERGAVIGTPAYMSPEQAAGHHALDARSDVYSLGAVVYEMLVGAPPRRPNAGPARADAFDGPPSPSVGAARPELPPEIDAWLRRALAARREDRFASADELRETLLDAAGAHAPAPRRVRAALAQGGQPPAASLAVLPFANLAPDATSDYLPEGITEEILTRLARVGSITVCAPASALVLRGQADDLREVGRRLNVESIVLGTVRRAGDRLRVTARLVDAATGLQRWGDRYDRALHDLFAIEDEIAAAVVDALVSTLAGARAPADTRPPVRAVEAHDAVLQGRHFWRRRTEADARHALHCFSHALTLDPNHAPAYAGIADVWATRAVYGFLPPREAMDVARANAERALALDPASAAARTTRGVVLAAHHWDWARAERAFRDAIASSPSHAPAHQWLAAACLSPLGRHAEALASLERARALDPLSPLVAATLAAAHLYAGRGDLAVQAAHDALRLDADCAIAHYFLGQALVELGALDAALTHAERACTLSGNTSETLGALGHALGVRGETARAEAVLAELEGRAAEHYVAPTHLAQVHLGLDAPEAALDRLEAAASARATDLLWVGVRPSYAPLRTRARFTALLERLGLPPAAG